MNRRDTILIAVLINMGLLVVLFVGALKPKGALEQLPEQKLVVKKEEVKKAEAPQPSAIDQVDHILSQYVEKEVKQAAIQVPPPPVPATPSELKAAVIEPPKLREVIVKQGDVLEKIAKTHRTTVEEILRANKLSDTSLQIGQILYLPESATPMSTENAKYYIVKNGDNPWTIAIKNKIKVEDLLMLNNLDEAKAKKIKPGDKLRIQ